MRFIMETKQGRMHIGAQIQKRVKELGLTNSQFANLINLISFNIMYRTILLHPQMKLFQNE